MRVGNGVGIVLCLESDGHMSLLPFRTCRCVPPLHSRGSAWGTRVCQVRCTFAEFCQGWTTAEGWACGRDHTDTVLACRCTLHRACTYHLNTVQYSTVGSTLSCKLQVVSAHDTSLDDAGIYRFHTLLTHAHPRHPFPPQPQCPSQAGHRNARGRGPECGHAAPRRCPVHHHLVAHRGVVSGETTSCCVCFVPRPVFS